MPAVAPRLRLTHHTFHHSGDVMHIQPTAVEGAVGGDRAQHLADRLHATFAGRLGRFDDDPGGAHSHDHSVPAVVEGKSGVLHRFVGRCGAGGEEARADPLNQAVARDIVAGDDEDAAAPPGPNPVLGKGDALRRAGACGVDLCVRPASADDLCELGVAHRKRPEEESPVEGVGLGLQFLADCPDALVDLPRHRVVVADACAQGQQQIQRLPSGPVDVIAIEFVREAARAREGRGEDYAGVVAHRVRQHPAVGQLRADTGCLVVLDEWDPGIAQRVQAGTDRQSCDTVERGVPLLVHAELPHEVERAHPTGELDDVRRVANRDEAARAVLVLDQPRDVLVEHPPAEPRRDGADELLAGEEPADVRVVEDVLGAGQAEGRAGDDDGAIGGGVLDVPAGRAAGLCGDAALDRCRGDRCRGDRCRGDRCRGDRCRGLGRRSEAGRVQSAQRLVERHDVAGLRVVGEQGDSVVVRAHDDVLGEPVQGLLRAELDEHPCAGVVEGVEALDELHRRGHLAAEDVEDLLLGPGGGRVELAVHVGDQRQPGRRHVQSA